MRTIEFKFDSTLLGVVVCGCCCLFPVRLTLPSRAMPLFPPPQAGICRVAIVAAVDRLRYRLYAAAAPPLRSGPRPLHRHPTPDLQRHRPGPYVPFLPEATDTSDTLALVGDRLDGRAGDQALHLPHRAAAGLVL